MANWDSSRFELRYDRRAFQPEIIEIEAYRLSLNKLILPQAWKADLQNLFIIRSVHGTTAIEGNPLSEEEVSRQLRESAGKGARDQVHRQTENAARAFKWVEENFDPPRLISHEDILTN